MCDTAHGDLEVFDPPCDEIDAAADVDANGAVVVRILLVELIAAHCDELNRSEFEACKRVAEHGVPLRERPLRGGVALRSRGRESVGRGRGRG